MQRRAGPGGLVLLALVGAACAVGSAEPRTTPNRIGATSMSGAAALRPPLPFLSLPAPPEPWPFRSVSAPAAPGCSPPAPAGIALVLELGPKDPPAGRSLAFAPDGSVVFAPDGSADVCLWDAKTAELRARLRGHGSRVTAASFDPSAPLLVTVAAPDSARLWDLRTGASAAIAPLPEGKPSGVVHAPDGRAFALLYPDAVALCEENGALRARLEARATSKAVFAERGSLLLTVSRSSREGWKVWDVATGRLVHQETGLTGASAAAIAPDGTWVAWGTGGQVTLTDLASGRATGVLATGPGVELLDLGPDGRTLVVGKSKELVAWDMASQKPIGRPLPVPSRLARIARDGSHIAARSESSSGGTLFGPQASSGFDPGFGNDSQLVDVAFSPDSRRLVGLSGHHAPGLASWDASTGQRLGALSRQRSLVRRLAFSPDGAKLATLNAITTANDAAAVERDFIEVEDEEARISRVDHEDIAQIWDLRSGTLGFVQYRLDDEPFSLAYSQDGSRLAIGGRGAASLYDATSGKTVQDYRADQDTPHLVAFGENGARFFWVAPTGGAHGELRVHAARTGGDERIFPTPPSLDRALAVSPDGRTVALGGDGGLAILDAGSGAVRWQQKIASVRSVRFRSDGRAVVSASDRTETAIWDTATGAKLAGLRTDHGLGGVAALDPSGRFVIVGGGARRADLWDVERAQRIATIPGDDEPVLDLAWSPAGDVVAIARGAVQLVRLRDGASVFLRAVTLTDDTKDSNPVGLVHTTSGLFGGDPRSFRFVRFRPEGDVLRAPLLSTAAVPSMYRPNLLPELFAGCPL